LNPIENNKYNEINLKEEDGISRSLLIVVAMIPRIKNRSVGLVRLFIKRSKFMLGVWNS
jgi:hypothetical protein